MYPVYHIMRGFEVTEGPHNKIPRENFDAIKKALINAANASSKATAASHISLAEYHQSMIRRFLDYYVDEQLTSAIEYAQKATGKVKNKEHLMDNATHFRLKFEGMVKVSE